MLEVYIYVAGFLIIHGCFALAAWQRPINQLVGTVVFFISQKDSVNVTQQVLPHIQSTLTGPFYQSCKLFKLQQCGYLFCMEQFSDAACLLKKNYRQTHILIAVIASTHQEGMTASKKGTLLFSEINKVISPQIITAPESCTLPSGAKFLKNSYI